MVQASGYRLTGPVQRNGAVYLANVLGSQDDLERLVIDARTAASLQRYRASARRRYRVQRRREPAGAAACLAAGLAG